MDNDSPPPNNQLSLPMYYAMCWIISYLYIGMALYFFIAPKDQIVFGLFSIFFILFELIIVLIYGVSMLFTQVNDRLRGMFKGLLLAIAVTGIISLSTCRMVF